MRLSTLPTLLLFAALLAACGDEAQNEEPLEPRLSVLEEKVFGLSCASSSCHDSTIPAGGLDLSEGNAWDNLVGVEAQKGGGLARVEPGKPGESFLYIKVTGPGDDQGAPMPLNGRLSQAKIDAIREWIANGAKKD